MTGDGNLVEQRGYFWWSKQKLPRDCFAPSDCANGTLIVRSDGRATLELDGVMPGKSASFAALANPPGRPRDAIQGKLKDGSSVLLFAVVGDGGTMSTRGISFERFSASGTLIGQRPFRRSAELSSIKEMVFDLEDLQEWMMAGGIQLTRSMRRWSDNAVSVKYRPLVPYKFSQGDLSINISRFVNSSYSGQNLHRAELNSISYLKFKCSGISFAGVSEIRQQISDFIGLFTGEFILREKMKVIINRQEVDFYFVKMNRKTKALRTSDCYIPYAKVLPNFGPLLMAWMQKRTDFGPAFYVFLGHKRQNSNYLENQFSVLVSGLEAYSRFLNEPPTSASVEKKVKNIIASVPDSKHRSWLSKRLRNAAEPNLQQRLFAVPTRPPLSLEISEMQKFCEHCMRLRHDISHFSGPRKHPSYDAFLRDVHRLTFALETLYLSTILNEIGLGKEVLKDMLFKGFQSFRFRTSLAAVGFTLPPEDGQPAPNDSKT